MGFVGKTSQIYGSPNLRLIGLKGSAAKVLVPVTTRHLKRSFGVNALTDQRCFGSTKGACILLGCWFYWCGRSVKVDLHYSVS